MVLRPNRDDRRAAADGEDVLAGELRRAEARRPGRAGEAEGGRLLLGRGAEVVDERSRAVAVRCGFTFEGVLRADSLGVDGQVRDTAVYARVRGAEEPAA